MGGLPRTIALAAELCEIEVGLAPRARLGA